MRGPAPAFSRDARTSPLRRVNRLPPLAARQVPVALRRAERDPAPAGRQLLIALDLKARSARVGGAHAVRGNARHVARIDLDIARTLGDERFGGHVRHERIGGNGGRTEQACNPRLGRRPQQTYGAAGAGEVGEAQVGEARR